MTPIPENALPNYDKREIEDPVAFFRTLFHLRDIKEERAIPAIVTDYDSKTGVVTALPMMKFTFDTRDGEAEVDRYKVKVRTLKMCHGGFSISFPIFKGDTGWLIAGDRRSGEAIKKNSEILVSDITDEELKDRTNKPEDFAILSFDNGFFLPFSWNVDSIGDEKSLIIRNVSKDDKLNITNDHGVYGTYPWSMIEIQRDGMVNAYGQGRKFTVRKEGLYLDDKPLKFLDDLILKEGEGIEIEKTLLDDGKIQFKIGNTGVIALEEGDNITIEPVKGKPGTFKISSSDESGTLKSITIDSPDGSVEVEEDGTDSDPEFHLKVIHPTIGNGIITIQRNGVNIGSFSMNQQNNGVVNIEVPTINYPVTSVDKKINTFGLDVNPTTGDVKIENTGLTGIHVQQSGQSRYAQITDGTDTKHGDVEVKTKDITLTLPTPQSIDAVTVDEENKLDAIAVELESRGNVNNLTAEEKVTLYIDKSKANTPIKTHDGSELGKVFGDGNDITLPQTPEIPDITITSSGIGNVVTGVTADGHDLTVTKGTVKEPSGSDYIGVSQTGVVSAKISPTSTDSHALVTTDTAQTITGAKKFSATGTATALYVLADGAEMFQIRKGADSDSSALIYSPNQPIRIYASDKKILLESSSNNVVLRWPPTDLTSTSSLAIATLGWVNDKFLRIANLVAGSNITITPDTTNPKKLIIAATQQTIPDIVVDASAVTSGKAVGGLTVDATNKHKIIASAVNIPTELKNPYALTFTGSASGSYDGSAEKTVNIPSAPQGEKTWVIDGSSVTVNASAAKTIKSNVKSDWNASSGSDAEILNKPSSLKNPYALTIKKSGSADVIYDGSAAKTITLEAGGATLDRSFSWEGTKVADIAASANIAVDSKTIQGSNGITVTETNRVITISGSGSQVAGYTTPAGTYDYEVTGQEWDSANHRIVIHKVKKTYENGLLKTREAVTDEYIQFVEETV